MIWTVYLITCLRNGRVYVGSSIDWKRRKAQHLSGLRSGKHFNRQLQYDFDRFGLRAFSFHPVSRHPGRSAKRGDPGPDHRAPRRNLTWRRVFRPRLFAALRPG